MQDQIQSYLHLHLQINQLMILFCWYVFIHLIEFFFLLFLILICVYGAKGFFLLLIGKFTYRPVFSCLIRITQYNTFSFVLLSLFFTQSTNYPEKFVSLWRLLTFSLSLSLFVIDVSVFLLAVNTAKVWSVICSFFLICSHRSTNSSSILNAYKSNKSNHTDDEDDNHSMCVCLKIEMKQSKEITHMCIVPFFFSFAEKRNKCCIVHHRQEKKKKKK